MLSFKQYITESYSYPLYHSIRLYGRDHNDYDFYESIVRKFKKIMENGLSNNTMQDKNLVQGKLPGLFSNGSVKGISLTRDIRFAKIWATQGIILELDSARLRHNYKIVPISYWRGRTQNRDEAEDFVVTDKAIAPNYIKTVHIGKVLMNIILNDIGPEPYNDFQKAVYHHPLKVY